MSAEGAVPEGLGPVSESPFLSIVVPLLNERDSLAELHERIGAVLAREGIRGEIIFVDDGSADGSFKVLAELHERDSRVRVIQFRRCYGKAAALAVGFARARGEIVITMDADLQDDPEEIPRLIAKLGDGYDLASGWKKTRHDPISKRIPSKFFNWMTCVISGVRLHDINCGLKAYRAEVTRSIELYGELHRFVPVLAHWQGFRVGEIVVKHHARKHGRSKYGLRRFVNGLLDLMTIVLITRFLRSPLHLFGSIGLCLAAAGFVINAFLASLWFVHGSILGHHPLLMLGVLLMIVGLQLVTTGLLAEMLTRLRGGRRREYSVRMVL